MSHKMLLLADIHFGIKNNSEKYLQIMEDYFLKSVAKIIKTRNITDCRILGDLFDCRNAINVKTLNTVLGIFQWFQTNMSDVRWQILLGNHDIYYKNRIDVNSLEALKNFDNVEIVDRIKKEKINGKKIITFPWIVEGSEIKTYFDSYCNGSEKFDLCLGHFEIRGFEVVRGHVDEDGTPQGKFSNFSRVFTGHYHIRSTKGHISYLGCPYQLNWNDYGDDKGLYIYDLDNDNLEFIKNNLSPIYVRVKISDILKDENIAKKIKGNTVKIVIDKKYGDTDILKAMTRVESSEPIKIDTDNQYVEQEIDDDEIDISDMSDPCKFLLEYIKKIEIDEEKELDKKILSRFARDLYNTVVSDKD